MIELRAAVAADAATITAIYIDSWNIGFGHLLGARTLTEGRITRMGADIEGAADWVLAEVAGAVTGFACVGPARNPSDPELGEMQNIAVDPSHWRRGIGTALMTWALDRMRSQWTRAILWTPADYERGHAFYRSTGWYALDMTRAGGTHVAFGRDLLG